MSKVLYTNVVGCMMYAMVLTRLDISHAFSVVSRYMVSLGKGTLETCKMGTEVSE